MKFTFPFLALAFSTACGDPIAPDMLLFANGDQLRGSFAGFGKDGDAALSRDGMKEPMRFGMRGLNQVVLRGGVPAQTGQDLSQVVLRSGEKIPGILRSIDASSIVVETRFAGSLTLPRQEVAVIRPNSAGGAGRWYAGPFRKADWLDFSDPSVAETATVGTVVEKRPDVGQNADTGTAAQGVATARAADNKRDGWRFEGSSWFWAGGETASLLALPDALPDRFVCTMDLEWTGMPNFSIGYHAGMEPLAKASANRGRAKKRERTMDEALYSSAQVLGSDEIPAIMGNALVVYMQSNTVSLNWAMWQEGQRGFFPIATPIDNTAFAEDEVASGHWYGITNIVAGNRCRIEIRADRSNRLSQILVDGRMRLDWQGTRSEDPSRPWMGKYGATGKALCFVVNQPASTLRISGIRISDWGSGSDAIRGIDGAQSKDVLTLADGSDRMAGSMLGLKDAGALLFKGSYGNLSVPLERIGEIHLASAGNAPPAPRSKDNARLGLDDAGSLRGEILPNPDADHFLLRHPVLGELRVPRDAVSTIDFEARDSFAVVPPLDEESLTE